MIDLVQPYIELKYPNEIYIRITDTIVKNIKPYYWISNYGNIFSTYNNKFIIPQFNYAGYLQVGLMTYTGRIHVKVHRLVMMVFNNILYSEKYQVNHIYGDKTDNYVENLEWVSGKENVNHAINTGLRSSYKGELNPFATITDSIAKQIKDLIINTNYTDKEISEMMNVPESIIKSIANGSTWAHLFTQEELTLMKSTRRGYYISNEQKHSICSFYQENSCNYNKIILLVKAALTNINLECTERNIRIAKRLYYRYDSNEITSLYNY